MSSEEDIQRSILSSLDQVVDNLNHVNHIVEEAQPLFKDVKLAQATLEEYVCFFSFLFLCTPPLPLSLPTLKFSSALQQICQASWRREMKTFYKRKAK
mmetsp:Transcript_36011/g.93679  ORF Transcript_36011/g.93679 Transcript_36011/m.93679 type:complete len:98 (+) Transcript_36011:23-316(+)